MKLHMKKTQPSINIFAIEAFPCSAAFIKAELPLPDTTLTTDP